MAKFSVINRKNMFVIKETTGAVFLPKVCCHCISCLEYERIKNCSQFIFQTDSCRIKILIF